MFHVKEYSGMFIFKARFGLSKRITMFLLVEFILAFVPLKLHFFPGTPPPSK